MENTNMKTIEIKFPQNITPAVRSAISHTVKYNFPGYNLIQTVVEDSGREYSTTVELIDTPSGSYAELMQAISTEEIDDICKL